MGHSIFGKHPLTVYRVVRSDQTILPIFHERTVCDALKTCPFRSIKDTSEGKSYGFVTLENHRSAEFGPANVNFGVYHAFSFRIDERKVPPAALKEAIADAEEQELRTRREAGMEGKGLPKHRRRELREQCFLRMKGQVPPVPKVIDVVWHHDAGLLYACEKSGGALEMLEAAFRSVFGPALRLIPFCSADIIPGLSTMDPAGGKFLTWLYGRREETNSYSFGPTALNAWISDSIEVSLGKEVVRAKADSDYFPEIDTGLRHGKTVTRANVTLEADGRQHTLSLTGALFPIVNLDGAAVVKPRDPEELPGAVIEAAGNMETAVKLLCALVSCWADSAHGCDVFTPGAEVAREVRCLQKFLLDWNASMTITSTGGQSVTLGKVD